MAVVDYLKLKVQLTAEEKREKYAYKDTKGNITVGIGRNLTSVGLSDPEIDFLYDNDVDRVERDFKLQAPWVFGMDEVRQRVFYDLCFNMGITKLLTFKNMITYSKIGYYSAAADALHESLWDSEVGDRAPKLENMLRTGLDA